jgi:hypothetical protein
MKTPRKTGFVSLSWASILCIVLFLIGTGGCALPFLKAKKPKAPVGTAILRDPESGKLTQAGLQALVMDFADKLVMAVWQATDEILKSGVDAQTRFRLHQARALGSGTAMSIAAGRNPAANLLDMVTYVTLARMNQEEYWVPKVLGTKGQPLLQAMRKLENDIWTLSGEVLTSAQQEDLRIMIREWRAAHPKGKYYMAAIPLKDLAQLRGESPVAGEKETRGFLAEVGKALVKVDEAFLLAERGMFYVERMPRIVALQTDLLLSQVSTAPMVTQLVVNSNRITKSFEELSQTAQKLPQTVAVERQAAIKQVTDWLEKERQRFMADLEAKEPQARTMMLEMQQTLTTGLELTNALNTLGTQFQAGPDAPPSPPVDYVKTMGKATEAMQGATQLIESLDKFVAGEEAEEGKLLLALKQINTETQALLNHAFWLGLMLIVVFMFSLVAALLCYRWLAHRLVDFQRTGEK